MINLAKMLPNVVDLQHKQIKTTPLKKVEQVKIAKRERNFMVVPWRAAADKRINKTASYVVLTVICGYTNRHGETWVSQATVSEVLGVSQQAISKHIHKLIEFGYLEVVKGHGRGYSSRLRVVFDSNLTLDEVKANTPAALREDNTPISKEEGSRRIKELKERLKSPTKVQPQKLCQTSAEIQPLELCPDTTSEVVPEYNLEGVLTQPTSEILQPQEVVQMKKVYNEEAFSKWLEEE